MTGGQHGRGQLRQQWVGGAAAGGMGAFPVGLQVIGHMLTCVLQLVLIKDDVKHLLRTEGADRVKENGEETCRGQENKTVLQCDFTIKDSISRIVPRNLQRCKIKIIFKEIIPILIYKRCQNYVRINSEEILNSNSQKI